MTPPMAVETSTSVPNKNQTQPVMMPVVEETTEASSPTSWFPKDYIPLINPSSKQVNLHKDAKYPLMEPLIPEGVIVEGDMLCMIPGLKYVNHDITNEEKFP